MKVTKNNVILWVECALAMICLYFFGIALVFQCSFMAIHDVAGWQVILCWLIFFVSGVLCIILARKNRPRYNHYR